MIRRPITIINKLGLHARATAKLVNTASRFDSSVRITPNWAGGYKETHQMSPASDVFV